MWLRLNKETGPPSPQSLKRAEVEEGEGAPCPPLLQLCVFSPLQPVDWVSRHQLPGCEATKWDRVSCRPLWASSMPQVEGASHFLTIRECGWICFSGDW